MDVFRLFVEILQFFAMTLEIWKDEHLCPPAPAPPAVTSFPGWISSTLWLLVHPPVDIFPSDSFKVEADDIYFEVETV